MKKIQTAIALLITIGLFLMAASPLASAAPLDKPHNTPGAKATEKAEARATEAASGTTNNQGKPADNSKPANQSTPVDKGKPIEEAAPGAPTIVHRVGYVSDYEAGVSITIKYRDGQFYTFKIAPDVKIVPHHREPDLKVGAYVTIIAPRNFSGDEWIAQGIVVHPHGPASLATSMPTGTVTPPASPTPTGTITPMASPTPTGTVISSVIRDDTDPAWQYSGNWAIFTYTGQYPGPGPYNGSIHYSQSIGDYAQITFTGQQFTLIFTKHVNRGDVDVYVDGVKLATFSEYGPTAVSMPEWQQTWTSPALASGTHTVRFMHMSGTFIDIDAIQIFGP
jgi:hypothetical protein